jgi:DNA mismatch endonuclease Vsr
MEDGERLQGLPRGWTRDASQGQRSVRWNVIGNAVTVGVARWVGERLALKTPTFVEPKSEPLDPCGSWPPSGWGASGQAWKVDVTPFPECRPYRHLADFLSRESATPLSHRAAKGFLARLRESQRPIPDNFIQDLQDHIDLMSETRRGRVALSALLVADTDTPGKGSWASSPEARHRMQANGPKNTAPELALRKELHRRGLRYRLHCRAAPEVRNKLDIVFGPSRVCIDVRGCFWHACPRHGTWPKANSDHWREKLRQNVERDTALGGRLEAAGWTVVVVWEHDDPKIAAAFIEDIVRSRRGGQ